jgi:CheY-like chemotaxis protein
MKQIDHLLLIDDSEATNNFHERLLGKLSFAERVSICRNGQDGLDFLSNEANCPSLIFLDLNMPILNGFEFLERVSISFNPESKCYPLIVVLTSSDESVDQARCKNIYQKIKFFTKPLTISQINEIWALVDLEFNQTQEFI